MSLFEVEEISSVSGVSAVVIARKIDDVDFELTENILLGGVPIESADIPRKLSDSGAACLDTWVFFLENEKDKAQFHKGQIVKLA